MKNGLITPFNYKSKYINRDVKLGLYLPKDYSPFITYQLFLCFDGQDLSQIAQIHTKYERMSDELLPALFVFIHYPDVVTRTDEYHPDGKHRQQFQQFIVDELLPYISDHFHIQHNNEPILAGDSLAASVALSLTLDYPTIFSKACLFSPMITEDIIAKINTQNTHKEYFIVVGKEENHFKLMSGKFADFLTPIRQFVSALKDNNLEYCYEELEGGHSWKTWKPQIDKCLNYYLS